jgi:hypothetical protein
MPHQSILLIGRAKEGASIRTYEHPKFPSGHLIRTYSPPEFLSGHLIRTYRPPEFLSGHLIRAYRPPEFLPGRLIRAYEPPEFLSGRLNIGTFGGFLVQSSHRLVFPCLPSNEKAIRLAVSIKSVSLHPTCLPRFP